MHAIEWFFQFVGAYMDLAKIIIGLRTQLECTNAAIAAMEALERALDAAVTETAAAQTAGVDPEVLAVKRPRGRPRKYVPAEPTAPPTASEANQGGHGPDSSLS